MNLMTEETARTIGRLAIACILFLTLSCDLFKEDRIQSGKEITFGQTEFYTLPGSSLVIDLNSVIKESFTRASLRITQNPLRGKLVYINDHLMKYRSAYPLAEGKDEFVFSVQGDDGRQRTGTVTINTKNSFDQFPCTLSAIEDKVQVRSGSSVSIDVLGNDHLCDAGNSNLKVSINSEPRLGEARLVNTSRIEYSPGPEFDGYDEVVYQLSTADNELISLGLITLMEGALTILRLPDTCYDLFFVNEKTGFLSGNKGLYKTTDGGEKWHLIVPDRVGSRWVAYNDIFFLDASRGYAALTSFSDEVGGGLMTTMDGGDSWQFMDLEYPVQSVVFTSSTTGFLGLSTYADWPGDNTARGIFKTDDGGINWHKVFDDGSVVHFANSATGYAYHGDKVFMTSDGGQQWDLMLDHEWINHLEVTSENNLFIVLSTAQGSILRSQQGGELKRVADFGNSIVALGVSHDTDFGLAVVYSGLGLANNPYLLPLSIYKTLDGGVTWNKPEIGGYLFGFPLDISIPSEKVAYILCKDMIVRYSTL